MAFPTNLTYAVDGITDVMADHLNNLEAKVGIDSSLVSTSLDYLLKNPGSVDPGHVHSGYQVAGSYITALTGDVAASGPGSAGATIQAGAVSLSKMANLAAHSIIGNNTADPATPLALSATAVKSLLAITQADVANLASDLAAKLPIATYQNPASISPGHKHANLYKPDGSVAVAVDANGKVGIGTASPNCKLQINQAADDNGLRIYGYDDRAASYISIAVDSGGGTQITSNDNWALVAGAGKYISLRATDYYFGLGDTAGAKKIFIRDSNDTIVSSINSDGDGYFNGKVGIGTPSPNASALLHLSSTTKGFLPPVMTTAQKAAISSPPAGLVVFDATLAKLCIYSGSAWQTVTSA